VISCNLPLPPPPHLLTLFIKEASTKQLSARATMTTRTYPIFRSVQRAIGGSVGVSIVPLGDLSFSVE